MVGRVWWHRAAHIMVARKQRKRGIQEEPGENLAPRTHPWSPASHLLPFILPNITSYYDFVKRLILD
jgi:hypothetical protein